MASRQLTFRAATLPFGLLILFVGCGEDRGALGLGLDAGNESTVTDAELSGVAPGSASIDGGVTPAQPTATIIVLPDTQYYTYSADSGFYNSAPNSPPDHAGVFGEQTAWILAQRQALNINVVLHVGDVVDIPSDPGQWNIASTAMHRFDGIIPYVIVPGNHDDDDKRQGLMDSYFGPATMPWITGTKIIGQMENNYALLDIGGRQWLVVALEFSPTDASVEWADKVLKAFPDRPAILVTHGYLYSDGTRYNLAVAGRDETQTTYQWWYPQSYEFTPSAGMNDGEMLWQKLVLPNSNVRLVFCGHQTGPTGGAWLTSSRPDGTVVHQMLSDYQWIQGHHYGFGFLRIVQLDFAAKVIRVQTYSPDLDKYITDDSNQFTLDLNL
ncbi:MAG TPA: metallophosphoesterase [Polyangia bacterium]